LSEATPSGHDRVLVLHLRALAEDAVGTDPAVDVAAIVADLEAPVLNRFHEMQVLRAVHAAEHDVAHRQRRPTDRRHRPELTGLDLSTHRIAARTEGPRLAPLQACDMIGRPSQRGSRTIDHREVSWTTS